MSTTSTPCSGRPADCPTYQAQRENFCKVCGRCDPARLKGLRFVGFLGVQSTNPKMEEFWATGDPEVFDRPE